ncbi:haloalkane dehalogenase [Myxococcus stipitatus DSM 14675]|uniref:Haloalkane dehalogenase n=1 Tax=Myxococcus stipitatus (strain DSM 14675 / JCM 12634 / Mx s8) TaxID=1278073 RepID=L7U936_MYXSD|nr:alpha/beta hydrolase [Myxococcus stipitatus]AGC42944.1 haloalkane dehalogenase [Myxococcus stipitatus DSM 14675]
MKHRFFLEFAGLALAASTLGACASHPESHTPLAGLTAPHGTDAAAWSAARRFASLSFGRIAYVERGAGDAALFLHGAPLNGFQWRGAFDRLCDVRRCIAPDFMGLGYSDVPEAQPLDAAAQADMLAALLDSLGVSQVDIVASDSGGAVAQLFLVKFPQRVRTLLLTNCDTEPNSPPPKVMPVIELARAGTLAAATAAWLTDPDLARSTLGNAAFQNPAILTDEVIETYAAPLVSTPKRQAQYHAFHTAFVPNPLAGIEAKLLRTNVPVRIVWGQSDDIFPNEDAHYLDRTLPGSRGIRFVPGGKLFFQEENPDIIAEEALRLWKAP